MKQMVNTQYEGNIKPTESIFRMVVGLVLILVSLHTAIIDNVTMSYPILIGSVIVLTGIAAWDPIYALLRSLFSKNNSEKSMYGDVLPGNA